MVDTSFIKEISCTPIEELELIFETQKDLYSEEEMHIIQQELEKREKKQQEAFQKKLPKEIACNKCDGMNPFENDVCQYCGCKIDKSKYLSGSFLEESTDEENSGNGKSESYAFQYVISFLIPLVGFILGAIMLSKDDIDQRSVGKSCIILGIISTVLCSFIVLRPLF